jgi:hypothetical protein
MDFIRGQFFDDRLGHWRTGGNYLRFEILAPRLPCLIWRLSEWLKIPTRLEKHGHVRIDDYYWLKERENPEVIAYLNAENEYAEKEMVQAQPSEDKLFEEIKARFKQTDMSVPYQRTDTFITRAMKRGGSIRSSPVKRLVRRRRGDHARRQHFGRGARVLRHRWPGGECGARPACLRSRYAGKTGLHDLF